MKKFKRRLSLTLRGSQTIDESLSELAEQMTIEESSSKDNEPIVKNGRPPTSHSVHSFLHQYTGSFKKPPLRRPHSVIGGSLGYFRSLGPRIHALPESVSIFSLKEIQLQKDPGFRNSSYPETGHGKNRRQSMLF